MKKVFISLLFICVDAAIAVFVAFLIYKYGDYTLGSDSFCHIYKGSVLLDSIKQGNWYPLYDRYWYNGVQMMRYWAPLPVYFLAMCQYLAGGVEMQGYLLFVALILFLGGLSWLYIGIRKNRVFLGGLFGIIWFFLPNNLYALFKEGNLPRSLSMILLPLLFYCVYEYLFEDKDKKLISIIFIFFLIIMCHSGYAGMIAISLLIFMGVYKFFVKKKGKCLRLMLALVISFLLTGIWLYPSLKGGITSTDSSQIMKTFFQSAVMSLNPILRITRGCIDFYFGLATFIIAVFGILASKYKSQTGFVTAIIIFIGTTSSMYMVLRYLPGGQYLWMLRFISIALCMIMYSLLIWDTLRKWILVLGIVLLIVDSVPSYVLIASPENDIQPDVKLTMLSDNYLITKAREITKQRVSFIGTDIVGSVGEYLLTDFSKDKIFQTYGAGWQSAATANNIVNLNEAANQGFYLYLFDRSIAMGDDTVLISIRALKNKEIDIEKVTKAANQLGYQLVDKNTGYLLYHMDTYDNFGVVTQYDYIGIGKSSVNTSYAIPSIEEGFSDNLNDYTLEELSKYKMIILDGFTYNDKEAAEKLILDLSQKNIRIVINGDGIPVHKDGVTREFLGVECHSIVFENGYPILYTKADEYDCMLFDKDYRSWKTVYFNDLDKTEGYLFDNGLKLSFMGNVRNDHIFMIGLNLTYHYALTKDEVARELLSRGMGSMEELPKRNIVPIDIEYTGNSIIIDSKYDNVNTSLAYHDIFNSDKKIYQKNNLTYVDSGKTIITFKYTYMLEGIICTAIGIVGMLGLIVSIIIRSKGNKTE